MSGMYFFDNAGNQRKVKTINFYDTAGNLQTVKEAYFYDSAGDRQQFFASANRVATFTPAQQTTTGATGGANANWALGYHTSDFPGVIVAGGGAVVGSGLTTPGSVALPFPVAQKLLLGGWNENPDDSVFSLGYSNVTYGYTNKYDMARAKPAPTDDRVWTFFTTLLDNAGDLANITRTNQFGAVDFGDGKGPRLASKSMFFTGTGLIAAGVTKAFATWMWQEAANVTSLAQQYMEFSGEVVPLAGWKWNFSGIAAISVSCQTKSASTWVTRNSTGKLYAPVGSPYYAAGRGAMALASGTVPPGLNVLAVHGLSTADPTGAYLYTDEASAFEKMPNTMQVWGTAGSTPALVSWSGAWRMPGDTEARGQSYYVNLWTGGTLGSTNSLEFL